MREKIKITLYMTIIILATSYIMSNEVLAQTVEKTELEKAKEHFVNGEYKQAIIIYEQLLENNPNSVSLLKMKAIALSNLGDDLNSLKEFYKIIQQDPHNVIALTGMGVGFGNLGEYKESAFYLEKAIKENNYDSSFIYKDLDVNDKLVWDHIDCGVSKKFLIKEYNKAKKAEITKSCKENCNACGINQCYWKYIKQ